MSKYFYITYKSNKLVITKFKFEYITYKINKIVYGSINTPIKSYCGLDVFCFNK